MLYYSYVRADLLISVLGPHILFLASIISFYDLFTIKFIITLDENFETDNQLVSRNDAYRSQNQKLVSLILKKGYLFQCNFSLQLLLLSSHVYLIKLYRRQVMLRGCDIWRCISIYVNYFICFIGENA